MKLKLISLSLLLPALMLLLLVSCGGSQTEYERIKGASESTSTQVSTGEQHPVPQGTELLETVVDLWDQLADAKENEDAKGVYTRLSSDLRERCTLEDVEHWLPSAGFFFFFDGVMAVFLDADNPHRGVAEMAGEVISPEGERGAMGILMPMVWEEDDWRLVWPMDDPLAKGCPFGQ
jgi:hypothetical protein